MTKEVLFTIILPTYNRAYIISKALQSVIKQKYTKWELLIIDDGSTDNTQDIVQSFVENDTRIKYYCQENAERSAARNYGIRKAKGDYICFLDSDDYFLPNHLFTFYNNTIKNGDIDFFCSGAYLEENGQRVEIPYLNLSNYNPSKAILEATTLTPLNVCIKKECLNNNSFPEIYKKSYWEDTHLWIRLACVYNFMQIEEYTAVLVEHDNRSIKQQNYSSERISDHINLIIDLFTNYEDVIHPYLNVTDLKRYLIRKYKMFFYISRINAKYFLAYKILLKAIKQDYQLNNWPYFIISFCKLTFSSLTRIQLP